MASAFATQFALSALPALMASHGETVAYITKAGERSDKEILWDAGMGMGGYGAWGSAGTETQNAPSGQDRCARAAAWIRETEDPQEQDSLEREAETYVVTKLGRCGGGMVELILESREPLERGRREYWGGKS